VIAYLKLQDQEKKKVRLNVYKKCKKSTTEFERVVPLLKKFPKGVKI
jgi:hypothetical protein